jgi:hypothetical protein
MRSILIAVSLVVGFSSPAVAHHGGVDSCGGHNDRARGGYHAHDDAKYRACYPNSHADPPRASDWPEPGDEGFVRCRDGSVYIGNNPNKNACPDDL